MHGTDFSMEFPEVLTKYFIEVILDSHPIEKVDHVKAALRITRYRF